MSSTDIVLAAAGSGGGDKNYIEDVFSTYLYTGNDVATNIVNGINLQTITSFSLISVDGTGVEYLDRVVIDTSGYLYSIAVDGAVRSVVKYSAAGVIQWQKKIVIGGEDQELNCITIDNDFIYVGTETGKVVKLTTAGATSFVIQLSGTQNIVNDLIAYGGNIYAFGYYGSGSISAGYVAKLTTAGAVTFAKTGYTSTYVTEFKCGHIDSSGNIYGAGYVDKPADNFQTSCVFKFDSSGTIQWQKTYGGTTQETVIYSIKEHSGNLFVAGVKEYPGAGSASHPFIAKLSSSDGSVVDAVAYANVSSQPVSMDIDADGNLYAKLYASNIDKFSPSLTQLWSVKITPSITGFDYYKKAITVIGSDLYVTGSGNYYGLAFKFKANTTQPSIGGSITVSGLGTINFEAPEGSIYSSPPTGTTSSATIGTTVTRSTTTATMTNVTSTMAFNSVDGGDPQDGLVWIKDRSGISNNILFDTKRNALNGLISNGVSIQSSLANSLLTFNQNGFTVGTGSDINFASELYCSWTFRKAPKFFDVIIYNGNGSAGRSIAHNLGSTPGMIIIKSTSLEENWNVYHRSMGFDGYMALNATDGKITADRVTAASSSTFTLGSNGEVNGNNQSYVAYIFAHNAGGFGDSGTDNAISCGSFTTDGSGNFSVDLGYEPQYILLKQTTAVDSNTSWYVIDVIRGFGQTQAISLFPNATAVESNFWGQYLAPTATGFYSPNGFTAGATYIYMAIRRPMKVPTDATKVFTPTAYTSTNVDNRLVNTSIVTDAVFARTRNNISTRGFVVGDRLRGNAFLGTAVTNAEAIDADSLMTPTVGYGNSFSAMNGFGAGNDATVRLNYATTYTEIAYAFKRAPGFFDVVCYTGTGVATTVAHNLGVVPELMIVKRRSGGVSIWAVYHQSVGNTAYLQLQSTAIPTTSSAYWNDTSPTSSVFTVGTADATNPNSSSTHVAYLFASCPGVSKVGSYTGDDSNGRVIDCGFTAGARFVMVKRTDSAADWNVVDTARGIVSGTDPLLTFNSTGAELSTRDDFDPSSTGFIVNNDALNINTSGGTYIYLAIA